MRKELTKRITAMEGTLKPMSDVDVLVKQIADEIEKGGIPAIIKALRYLDKESPLDPIDNCPSAWHWRRIKELKAKTRRTEAEEAELQGYIETRRRQDEELRALQHLQNTDKTGLGGDVDSLGKKFGGGR